MGRLRTWVQQRYPQPEFPALAAQTREWTSARPLAGRRILDATPVFANTVAKYVAVLEAGAELVVSTRCGIPADTSVVSMLADAGVPIWDGLDGGFDVVLDCAGTHAAVPSRFGYVELTRSGADVYADCADPVILVDAGRLKRVETTLGTGDGWLRAMAHLGDPVAAGNAVVVFGGGKVGRGVALAATRAGAAVTVVDPAARPGDPWPVLAPDDARLPHLLDGAWCVVTAVGVKGVMTPWAERLAASKALLANMGAEDEFGDDIPASRALFDKVAVNFSLAEPTRLRYLDPVLAVSNAGALALLEQDLEAGLNVPPPAIEDRVIDAVTAAGVISEELRELGLSPG